MAKKKTPAELRKERDQLQARLREVNAELGESESPPPRQVSSGTGAAGPTLPASRRSIE